MRADPQNLPAGLDQALAGRRLRRFGGGDHSTAYAERGEIYDFVRDHGITGFATVAGDRHSFWAGLAAKSLPPQPFEPVGIAFVTGSISAPGMVEALEHTCPKTIRCARSTCATKTRGAEPEPTLNMLLRHGVRACLEYAAAATISRPARSCRTPTSRRTSRSSIWAGTATAVVRATSDAHRDRVRLHPAPAGTRAGTDGGPLRYRVAHRAPLGARRAPRLEQRILEGDPGLAV